MTVQNIIVKIDWQQGGVFAFGTWVIRKGQQWVVTGPNGSGKTYLAGLLTGDLPASYARVRFADTIEGNTALVTFSQQTHLARESWLQARWHNGWNDNAETVRQFLSFDSVNDINPFEVRENSTTARRHFGRLLQKIVSQLDISELMGRSMIHLSNGETRKALLARALLKSPSLLVLDDPFSGLDKSSCNRLQVVLTRLADEGLPMVLMVRRSDEIPPFATHRLFLQNMRIAARKRLHPGETASKSDSVSMDVPKVNDAPIGDPVVEMRNITIHRGRRTLFQKLNWTVRKGERWLLIGGNGSGKTTLISLITGDNPAAYSHDLRVFGRARAPGESLWTVRRRIGQVSPEIQCHFDTSMTCLQTTLAGRFDNDGTPKPMNAADRTAALTLLKKLGLEDDANRPLCNLSPGRQRLVLLARAILPKPDLLILDEPCQNLDTSARKMVLKMLTHLLSRGHIPTAIVTAHHPDDVPKGFNRRLCLDALHT